VFSILEAFVPDQDWVVLTSALLHAPFYFYISYGMIRYLFQDDRVTRDELYATGAAFTVVAWGFAYVFVAGQVVWPGSFVGAGGKATHTFFDLLFLSFTNLTSVGLSDVLPIDGHARSLVMIEQVAGVLYVALVVARLVGLTVVRASNRP
jgi:ion channel